MAGQGANQLLPVMLLACRTNARAGEPASACECAQLGISWRGRRLVRACFRVFDCRRERLTGRERERESEREREQAARLASNGPLLHSSTAIVAAACCSRGISTIAIGAALLGCAQLRSAPPPDPPPRSRGHISADSPGGPWLRLCTSVTTRGTHGKRPAGSK